MKKMLFVIALVSILTLSLTITVFAAEAGAESGAPKNRFESVQGKAIERIETFRNNAKMRRDRIRTAIDENVELHKQNKSLRSEISSVLKELRDNEESLEPSVIEQLESYKAIIKDKMTSLSETKGEIRDKLELIKEYRAENDYEAMESVFAEIETIQNARNELVAEINEALTSMLELIQQ